MGARGCVSNIQRYSIHDGGGIRSVVFLKGCPFFCPWCCNPENLSFKPQVSYTASTCMHCSQFGADGLCSTPPEACPTGAKRVVGQMRDVDDVLDEVERDVAFFQESGGGMTLSGGECLAQWDFSLALLEGAHERGISTAVETTLSTRLLDARALVDACDTLLVDLKVAGRERSLEVCGIDTDVRDANLREVVELGATVIGRLPFIPGFTDDEATLDANADTLLSLGLRRADVLPFHQLGEGKYDSLGLDYACPGLTRPSDTTVDQAVERLEARGLRVVVHGE